MPILLSCESLTKSFTSRPLFENLSFAIDAGDHIGLIGPNGSGKTTLLKIVAGIEPPDSGTRAVRKGIRIGYVPQDAVFTPGMSIDEVMQMQHHPLRMPLSGRPRALTSWSLDVPDRASG